MKNIALFKIATMVGEIPAHQEIPAQTMQNILQILKDLLSISRCTFWQVHEQFQECEIIAGLPLGDHGIGKKYLLEEHPDIHFIANSSESTNLINDPRENKLTRYFRGIVEEKEINAIGYFRVSRSLLPSDEKKDKKITGVLVIDSCGKKNTLEPDESNLCRTAASLIASRLVSFENFLLVLYNEWEDVIRNPATAIGGLSRRLEKMLEMAETPNRKEEIKGYLKRIKEEIEKMEKNI